jgi:hypothetical protein
LIPSYKLKSILRTSGNITSSQNFLFHSFQIW